MTLLLHLFHWIFEHSGECIIYRMHNWTKSSSIICTNDRHKTQTAETGGSHGGNFWNMTPCSWVQTNLLSIFRMETMVPIQMLRKPLDRKRGNCRHPKPSRQSLMLDSCVPNCEPLPATKLLHVKIPEMSDNHMRGINFSRKHGLNPFPRIYGPKRFMGECAEHKYPRRTTYAEHELFNIHRVSFLHSRGDEMANKHSIIC
jgi:hypothetical protein